MIWIVLLLGIAIAGLIGCIVRLIYLKVKELRLDVKISKELREKKRVEQEIANIEAAIAVQQKFKGFANTSTATPPPTKKG